MRPPARSLRLGDEPAAWTALGLTVEDGRMALGALTVVLTGEGAGVRALEVEGLRRERPAGLPIVAAGGGGGDAPAGHPLGASAVDHLVVLTGAIDETVAALADAGLDLRRRRDPPEAPARQAFFNLDTTILEVGETEGPARFWGLTLVVEDLDAAAERLGPLLGEPRGAVQPGRRIATVRREAGVGVALALITPRVRTR